ncbi:hypothetical protein ACLMK5_01070 [Streptococcus anginosus]|uniref:hypothetical protein n=1 Tax=Streptococcus TaxID=1301 RepID=UPI000869289C|nr:MULTISPECIES: hypothetical protein [Streptococcus]QBX31511.1 hypothetical protein Javan64_0049 [Streptococcus phage Javan64]MCW1031253.1 hypothetical protein [Streptococcus anginosus]MCW1067685.1 hypothetical protein [Streptococcus anginosus]MCW1077856.1 hypothetical protein [Streptococcus anginosus]SCQ09226.1 hypothetical protein SABVI_1495 [Streptococcus anginosus]
MIEMIEWIDGKITLNKHMIEDEGNPSDFEIFLLADIDMLTKIKVELLKGESRKNGNKR